MEATAIHALLLDESVKQAIPTAYQNDVIVHDLTALETTRSQRFIWVLRESGSHLITLDVPLEGARVTAASYLRSVAESYSCQSHLYYHFDGAELKPVSLSEAHDLAYKYGVNKPIPEPVLIEYREEIRPYVLVTRAQWDTLVRKYQHNPDGSKTFPEFLTRVNQTREWVSINWCGMYLGIESDGYAHT